MLCCKLSIPVALWYTWPFVLLKLLLSYSLLLTFCTKIMNCYAVIIVVRRGIMIIIKKGNGKAKVVYTVNQTENRVKYIIPVHYIDRPTKQGVRCIWKESSKIRFFCLISMYLRNSFTQTDLHPQFFFFFSLKELICTVFFSPGVQ